MIRVTGPRHEHLIRDLRVDLGLTRADDVPRSRRSLVVRRIPLIQLLGPFDLLFIDVRNDYLPDLSVRSDEINTAPVRKLAYGQARHRLERPLVIERGGEHLARIAEEKRPLLL